MTIKETNLTPYEGEIKAGQRLVKVGDMWIPVGVGGEGIDTSDATATAADILKGKTAGIKGEMVTGTLVPSTGSTFYKCASVDTTAKIWSGYLAVFGEDSTYSFEETVTEGLSCGAGFTPQVGSIYNADATVRVDKLFEGASAVPEVGLIFYLSFNGNAEPVVGTITGVAGKLTYGESSGIRYGIFDGNTSFTGSATESTVESSTVAVTLYVTDETTQYKCGVFDNIKSLSNDAYTQRASAYARIQDGLEKAYVQVQGGGSGGNYYKERNQFISVIITCDADGNWKHYIDSAISNSGYHDQWSNGFDVTAIQIGTALYDYRYIGYICDFAVWNRVLTEEEIAQVAARAASMNG